ncbi:hypothetical protein BH23BAC1_BH23BAC1_27040 [soil metagenome]
MHYHFAIFNFLLIPKKILSGGISIAKSISFQVKKLSLLFLYFTFFSFSLSAQQADEITYLAGDFQSAQTTGVWSDPLMWRQFNGAAWGNYGASGIPGPSSQVYVIGDITINQNLQVQDLTILTDARVTINNNTEVSNQLHIGISGVLQVNALLSIVPSGRFTIANEGVLNINFNFINPASTIWQGTENFSPTSVLNVQALSHHLITGINTNTYAGSTAMFGNINVSGAFNETWALVNSGGPLCHNNFTYNNSGTGRMDILDNNQNISILGNLVVQRGILSLGYITNANNIIGIEGNVQIFAPAQLNLNSAPNAANSSTTLQLKGNFTSAAGSALLSTNGGSHVEFLGNIPQQLDFRGNFGVRTHLVAMPGSEVILNNQLNLTNASNAVRIEGGTLDVNNFNITGLGNFALNSGTLKITSPDGINPLPSNLGNILNTGSRTYNQAATYWYKGQTEQNTGLPFGDGSTAKIIIIDNPTNVNLSKTTGIGPNGRLRILRGTFTETHNNRINGTGVLEMAENTTYRSSVTDAVFPALDNMVLSPVTTFELYAVGNQILRGAKNYHNIIFSGGGVKTLTVGTATVSGTVTIRDEAIVDLERKTLGGLLTALHMSGGRLRSAKLTNAQPEMEGPYIMTGGTVELYGTNENESQTLRGGKNYFNVEIRSLKANITTNNVNHGQGNITVNGSFTIFAPSVYEMGGLQNLEGAGSFTLSPGATLKYGSANGITTSECGTGSNCGNVRTPVRIFPEQASYGFVGISANMVTGNGLPSTIQNLYINRSNVVSLSKNITVQYNIIFTGTGNLITNNPDVGDFLVTLSPTGTITELETAHLIGRITTTRLVGNTSTFGGMGLEFTATQNSPGQTTLTRTTGTAIVGVEGNESILRYFQILPQNTDINATMIFRYFTAELNGISELDMELFQSPAIEGPWVAQGGVVNAESNFITRAFVNDFQFWTAASNANPLPVDLISFSGEVKENKAVLEWKTATETNNEGFLVEKSKNGIDFYEIAFLEGKGNSLEIQHYFFEDWEFLENSFYRLRQIDFNGDFSYSKIIHLIKTGENGLEISIYPNPVENISTLTIKDENPEGYLYYLSIFNSQGVEIFSYYDSRSSLYTLFNDNIKNLEKGVYILTLSSASGTKQIKFIKN